MLSHRGAFNILSRDQRYQKVGRSVGLAMNGLMI